MAAVRLQTAEWPESARLSHRTAAAWARADATKPPFSRRRWVAQAAGRPPFGGSLASSSLARSNGAATARAFSLKNLCAILLYQLGQLVELIHALHSEA